MRLDLSREQIEHIKLGLEYHINSIEEDMNKQQYKGLLEDTFKEILTVKKATLLYIKDFLKDDK